jgi:adenosylcobinamide-GDP ribazoletransferase
MNSFLLALQFLTIIPVKVRDAAKQQIGWSMSCFPLVGLLLGLALAGINKLLQSWCTEQLVCSIITVVMLIILTGGLHLDGLSDTADALLSRRPKDEMLKIMRDSHAGVMGILSLIVIILLKIAFLSCILPPSKTKALILMCGLSRWSLVMTLFLFPYVRQEGKAKVYSDSVNPTIFAWATIITVAYVLLFAKAQGLIILAIIALISYLMGKFMHKKIGGITGDTLGALNETIEAIVLLTVCVLARLAL